MTSLSQWFFGHLYVDTNKFLDEISVPSGSQQCAINNQSKETKTVDSTGLTPTSNGKKNLDDGRHGKLIDRKDHHQRWSTGNNSHSQAAVTLQNEGRVSH